MKKILLFFLMFACTSVLYAKEEVILFEDSIDNVYTQILENVSQYYSYYPLDTLRNDTIIMDWNKIYDVNNDNPQREKFKLKFSKDKNQTKVKVDYKYEYYSRKGWSEISDEYMKKCFNDFVDMIKGTSTNIREYKNFDTSKIETENKAKIENKKVEAAFKSKDIRKDIDASKMSLNEVQKAQLKKYDNMTYTKLYNVMLKNLKAEYNYNNIRVADKKAGALETKWVYPKNESKATATKRIKVFVRFKTKARTTTVVTVKMEKLKNSAWEEVVLSEKQQVSMYNNMYKKLEVGLK